MHTSSKGLGQHLVWLAVAVLGAFALGTVALARVRPSTRYGW